jgi:hypothetical protein
MWILRGNAARVDLVLLTLDQSEMMPPLQRKRPNRSRHRQSLRLLARQYRFHDLWCQQCHAQNPADVRRVDVLRVGDFLDGGEVAGFQKLTQAEAAGQRLEQGAVDQRINLNR